MESRKRARDVAEFHLVLSPGLGAGFRAGEAVRQRFGALAEATLGDLVAVVTELVDNAAQHGPRKPISVTVVVDNESIRGEVVDQGNPAVSIPRIGRGNEHIWGGLSMVDRLTSAWAVREGSTDVWFEIPLDQ